MKSSVKRVLASAVVAVFAGPLLATASLAGTGDIDLRVAAENTLVAQMGSDARDIQIEVKDGVATLSGWASGPSSESRARALVSRVPGMQKSFSTVRTWNSDGGA